MNKLFRIVTVCGSRSWGGMEMIAVKTAERLRKRGHGVVFMAVAESPIHRALKAADVPFHPFSGDRYAALGGWLEMVRWIRNHPVDLVHTHYSKDLWTIVPALAWTRQAVPVILTKHIGTRKPKRDPLHRCMYRRVGAVVAISKLIEENVRRTHPVDPGRIICIPNGVDLERFRTGRKDRSLVRTGLGIPADAFVIGMSGRLNWWKGYREYFQMAERVLQLKSDVWFLAVGGSTIGEEDEAEDVLRMGKSIGSDGRVVITGFRSDMPDLYQAMDLFVYPAYAEAFGMVLIEAMASGLPVISTDCDGVPEIVVHGRTGDLVPPRNADLLTEAVLALLEDRSKLLRYGAAGKQRVLELFDLEKNVDRIEVLYKNLVQAR